MSDVYRLQDKLAKLADSTVTGSAGRELPPSDAAGLTRSILIEIDEIMLRRALIFSNDKGSEITLEVANRRLLSVSDISPDGLKQTHLALIGKVFSEDSETLVEMLLELLRDLIGGTRKISVLTAKLDRPVDAAEIGCSGAALAKAWSLTLYESKDESDRKAIETFISYASGISTACAQIEGIEIVDKTGDERQLQQLAQIFSAGMTGIDDKLRRSMRDADDARCLVLAGGENSSSSVVHAKNGSSSAILFVPTSRRSDVLTLWRGIN